MACGEIGLLIEYFYSLSPREFYNIVQGYSKKQLEQQKNSWYQTRLIAYSAAFSMGNPDKVSIDKFLPEPWKEQEAKVVDKVATAAEVKAYMDAHQ